MLPSTPSRGLRRLAIFVCLGAALTASSAAVAELSGTVLWYGEPISGITTQNMHVVYMMDESGLYEQYFAAVQSDGTYSLADPPYGWTWSQPVEGPLGTGSSTALLEPKFNEDDPTLDFELSALAGLMIGALDVAPLTSPGLTVGEDYDAIIEPSGAVETYLAVGERIFDVYGFSGSERIALGSVLTPVGAGQITDVGTPSFDVPGVGQLQVDVRWQGELLSLGDDFRLSVRGEFHRGKEPITGANPFYTRRAAGVHGIKLRGPAPTCFGCPEDLDVVYGSGTATVVADAIAIATLDLAASTGKVHGQFTVDGAASDDFVVRVAGFEASVDTGEFELYLPPGSYEGLVEHAGTIIEGFEVEVIAGETTDLGSNDYEAPVTGTLAATLLWNGMPLEQDLYHLVWLTSSVTGRSVGSFGDGTESFSLLYGTHELTVVLGCFAKGDAVAEFVVTIPETSAVELDLAESAGRLIGVSAVTRVIHYGSTLGGCSIWLQAGVPFEFFLPAGDYTVHEQDSTGNNLGYIGSLDVSVAAGETTDLGTLAFAPIPAISAPADACEEVAVDDVHFRFPCTPEPEQCNGTDDDCDQYINNGLSCALEFGHVHGQVLWNGNRVADLSYMHPKPTTKVELRNLIVQGSSYLPLQHLDNGTYQLPLLSPAGRQRLEVRSIVHPACDILGTSTVDVVAGASVEHDIDLTETVGRVLGSVSVNGVLLRNTVPSTVNPSSCAVAIDDAGDLIGYFRPGFRSFGFTNRVTHPPAFGASMGLWVVAGETTTLAVDSWATPGGTNITLDFQGGPQTLGGTSVTFPRVKEHQYQDWHFTTVAMSDRVPGLPGGYDIVAGVNGPVVWDVSTEVVFEGPAEVCFNYDPSDVSGGANVLLARVFEGAIADITSSVDSDAGIICGAAPYLRGKVLEKGCAHSVFAVLETTLASACGDATCDAGESTISCPEDCGTACGDGVRNGGEVCEASDFGGRTCVTEGFDNGTLACVDCLAIATDGCSVADAVTSDSSSVGGAGGSDSSTSDGSSVDGAGGGGSGGDGGMSGSGAGDSGGATSDSDSSGSGAAGGATSDSDSGGATSGDAGGATSHSDSGGATSDDSGGVGPGGSGGATSDDSGGATSDGGSGGAGDTGGATSDDSGGVGPGGSGGASTDASGGGGHSAGTDATSAGGASGSTSAGGAGGHSGSAGSAASFGDAAGGSGGSNDSPNSGEGDCSCRVAGHPKRPASWGWLGALVGVTWLRRRGRGHAE